jgi:putative peptidoglycan lipid II flippase
MAAGTLLSRVTGFGRLFALAYALGFTELTDTYELANVTPNIVYELVLGGMFTATLVPLFVGRLATDDEEEAWRAISAVVTMAAAVLVVATVLVFVAAPLLIRAYTFGDSTASVEEQREVATTLLRMFAPQVLLYGVVTVTTALLNARRRFAAPMFAPVANNLVVIVVLLTLPHVSDDLRLERFVDDERGLVLLGLGTTAGVAAMAVAQLPALFRSGLRFRPLWDPRNAAVRTVLRLSGWTFGFTVANQLALWVVLTLANRGQGGDVAAYRAGHIFFQLPYGIFAVSVMTALLPDLSERWSLQDVDGYRSRLALGLRTVAVIIIPSAVGFLCLARPIVKVVLEHGALGSASAEVTSEILALLAIGLPGFCAYLYMVRAYMAMQDTRTAFYLYALENGINVVAALVLYPSLGVQGLALAYALAYTGAAGAAVLTLSRRIGGVEGRAVTRSWLRVIGASAVMGGAVLGVMAASPSAPLDVIAGVAVGVTVYVLAARALGIEELAAIVRIGRKPA